MTTLVNPFMSYPAAGGGGGFDPTTIAGCDLWLDASDTSSITHSGGAVSQWNDLSGGTNHATQATAGAKPTTGTRTVNGLNVLDFDGGDFFNLTTGLAMGSTQARSIFWLGARDSGGEGMFFGQSGVATPFVAARNGFVSPYGRLTSGAVTYSTSDVGTATAVMHAESTTSTLSIGWNGANKGSNGISTTTTWDWIGKYNGGLNINGLIAEVISFNSVLSSTDFNYVVNGMASKWGVTL